MKISISTKDMKVDHSKIPDKIILEFTRETISRMERNGFDIQRASDAPLNISDNMTMFAGSLLAHHANLAANAEEIWNALPGKKELIRKLFDIYIEIIKGFLDDPEDADEGNLPWSVE